MGRIIHFEIYAADVQRAIDFYTKVFDWKIEKFEGVDWDYWSVVTGGKDKPGINGGLMARPGGVPTPDQAINSFVCTVVVDDIDATGARIVEAGGTLAMAKFALAGMAWQAYYIDTEGNMFGIHQADPNAK